MNKKKIKVTFLPHPVICPEGKIIEAEAGISICQLALNHGLEIEHACEMVCACTTCHVIIHQGFNSLSPLEEQEEDLLDKAWGLQANSRLSCQALIDNQDLIVEIPKYSINQASEGSR